MLTNQADFELENSQSTPLDQINTKEFSQSVLKVGSIISMLENKKLNPTNLFLYLLENKNYQQIFVEITACKNFKEALRSLLLLYPSLVKSKLTKTAIKHLANGQYNRFTKTSLQ